MPNKIIMEDVDSSNLKAIGYDKENMILQVQYNNNTTYQFYDFRPEVWRDLQDAESKGRFMHKSVKGRYRFEKIEKQES